MQIRRQVQVFQQKDTRVLEEKTPVRAGVRRSPRRPRRASRPRLTGRRGRPSPDAGKGRPRRSGAPRRARLARAWARAALTRLKGGLASPQIARAGSQSVKRPSGNDSASGSPSLNGRPSSSGKAALFAQPLARRRQRSPALKASTRRLPHRRPARV
ncbi:hypothetical protein NL676_013645 [Syzygium grande]|nr:hypothetical protein NL676_013645 [Syzygium grande]